MCLLAPGGPIAFSRLAKRRSLALRRRKGTTTMGQRCTIGNHTACAGCGGTTNPTKSHHHVFRGERLHECLCLDCVYVTIAAATIILQTLHAAGFRPTADGLRDLIKNGRIIVGVQDALPLN